MRRSAICYTIGDMEDGIVLGQFLKAKGFSHRFVVMPFWTQPNNAVSFLFFT